MHMVNVLSEYADINKEVKHIKEIIERFECKIYGPRISVLSDMPKSPSADSDQMTNNYVKLEKLRNQYDDLLGQLLDKQSEVEKIIKDLTSEERRLIRYRYIDDLEWKDVGKKIGYSTRHTKRKHDNILEKLEKMAPHGIS